MSTVAELLPGQIIDLHGMSATFVARTEHPLWAHLQLVVWKLADGSWSHDALDSRQFVGLARPSTAEDRETNLRKALLHPSQLEQ